MNLFALRRAFCRSLVVGAVCLGIAVVAKAAVEPAVPVRMVPPVYPYELKRDGVTGVVTVSFEVDEQGMVQNAAVMKSTNAGFDQAALDAIKKWKFKPGKRDGVPAKMKLAIPLQFTLNE
jgi:periplasmic protein TonB